MANIFGVNNSSLLPVTKEIQEKLLKGFNVTTVDEFAEKLGVTFDPENPDMYVHTTNGLETYALIAALVNNIGSLIGEYYDTGSISEKIREHDDKLTTSIDSKELVNLMARVFGTGIYNNGTNADLYDITYDSLKLSFLAMQLNVILDVEGTAFLKEIPGKRFDIEYKNYTFPSSTTIFRYGITTTKNTDQTYTKINEESAYDYILNKSITHINDEATGTTLFLMLADGLSDDLQYQKFITNKEIFDVHDIYILTDAFNNISSFYYKRLFEPIQTSSFHINSVLNALKGNGVRFYFPKNMLTAETVDGALVYNDTKGLTSSVEVNNINSLYCDPNPILAASDAYIYFVDADTSIMGTDFTPDEYYIFRYSFRNNTFEKNTFRNRFITKNSTVSDDLARNTKIAMFLTGIPSSTEFEIEGSMYFNNTEEFKFRLDKNIKNNTFVYPLKGGILFKDPFYRLPLTRFYDKDSSTDSSYEEVYKTDSAAIMGSILRDRSVTSEKIVTYGIRSNNIASEAILPRHFNSAEMSQYSLTNFKNDYPAKKLIYSTNEIFSTFRGTNLDKFNIGKFCDLQIIQLGNGIYNENFSYTNSGKTSLVFNPYENKSGIVQSKLSLVSGYNNSTGQQPTLESYRLVATNNVETKVLTLTNRPGESSETVTNNNHKYHANMFITATNNTIHVNLDARVGQESKSCYFVPEKLGGTGGNDIADLYPILNSEEVEPGYFYSIKDDKAYKTTSKFDKYRIGFATNNYSVFAGNINNPHIALALKGFLDVKYHGELKPGDIVTNSNKFPGRVNKRCLLGDKLGRVIKIIDSETCTIFIL